MKSPKDQYIRRITRHENNYVTVDKRTIEDDRLSFRSIGLLTYLISRPPDWHPRISHLAKIHQSNPYAIKQSLQELQRYGYASLQAIYYNGRFHGKEWFIYEHPSLKSSHVTDSKFSRQSEKQTLSKTCCEVLKKERFNKERSQNEEKDGSVADATRTIDGFVGQSPGTKSKAFRAKRCNAVNRELCVLTLTELGVSEACATAFYEGLTQKDDWTANWVKRGLGFWKKWQPKLKRVAGRGENI